MKRTFLNKVFYAFIFIALSILLISCEQDDTQKVKLSTPSNLVLTENILTWDVVTNANKYVVSIDGVESSVQTNSYEIDKTEPGTYVLKVKAKGEGNYTDSNWSTSVSYVIEDEVVEEVFMIDENFDTQADVNQWSLGDVKNMTEFVNGTMKIIHTGVTPYPSVGKAMKVTLSKYPYIAVRVSELGGNNPNWAIKIKLAEDSSPSRSVSPNMSTTGLFYFDLTKVSGLENLDEAVFDLYIYIVESENNYVSIDFIKSVESIPTSFSFDTLEDTTSTNAIVTLGDGVTTITQDTNNEPASFKFNQVFDFDLAYMVDLFVSSLEENSTFTLKVDGITLIDEVSRYGHFGVNTTELTDLENGLLEVELLVEGSVTFNHLRSIYYDEVNFEFKDYDETELYDLFKTSGSADIEKKGNNALLKKLSYLPGNAVLRLSSTTNISTYPKLVVEVVDISAGTELKVKGFQETLLTISTIGIHTFDLTSIYQFDLTTINLDFEVVSDGDGEVEISQVALVRDEEMSKNALPIKGDSVEQEGSIIEEGSNSDNWGGNARVISRNGQLWIINTGDYSKAEIFGRNIDLSINRYLNIKVDELVGGANWKMDIILNPDTESQRMLTVQTEGSHLGLLTYDLYNIFNLTEETSFINRISISLFVTWGAGKTVKIDYFRLNDVAETNQIDNILPSTNTIVSPDQEVNVSATLKYGEGDILIKVYDEDNEDVTSTYLVDGVFKSSVEGTFKIEYTFDDLTAERLITVKNAPIITTTNPLIETINNEAVHLLNVSVLNPVENEELVVTAKFNGTVIDVLDVLDIDTMEFFAANTGVYELTFAYPDASDLVLELNVVTKWVLEPKEGFKINSIDSQTVVTYNGDHYWPSAKYIKPGIINNTPYLYINVESITGGTWKLQFGDEYAKDIISEGTNTGEFIINILDIAASVGYGETHLELPLAIKVFVVGSDVELVINSYQYLTAEEAIPYLTDEIININPSSNREVLTDQEVNVSASLKHGDDPVIIKVYNEDNDDVTSTYLTNNVFKSSVEGIFRIEYTYEDLSEERIITVKNAPIISTNNPLSEIINNEESHLLDVTVLNPSPDGELLVNIKFNGNEIDFLNVLDLDTMEFLGANTGLYELTFTYPDASDLVLELTVVTKWVLEPNEGFKINSLDGKTVVTYNGGFYWPSAKYVKPGIIDNTPYLYINVESITGGTWKLQFGDEHTVDLIPEGTETGEFIFNLLDIAATAGYGETHKELPLTFKVFVVGENIELVINSYQYLTAEEAIPYL